tara:strand:- start:272 stop:730 length:459 start_codon:yes stop_codon:yes gene_type:complete
MRNETRAQLWARNIKKLKGIDVFEDTRRREVVTYRALHVTMCKNTLKWTLTQIAKYYKSNGKSGYDHATVLHALRQFDIYCYYDKGLLDTMTSISGMDAQSSAELSTLVAKLKYIDSEFYSNIAFCIADAYEQTSIKHLKALEKEKKEKYAV